MENKRLLLAIVLSLAVWGIFFLLSPKTPKKQESNKTDITRKTDQTRKEVKKTSEIIKVKEKKKITFSYGGQRIRNTKKDT